MEKKRIRFIDLGKAMGILMVTWGHITKLSNPVDTWGSSFKLTIFFITAGFIVCYANTYDRISFKGYALKLLKTLGIPYVAFSLFSILFRFCSMMLKHDLDVMLLKTYLKSTFSLRGAFALWFLPALLFGELFFFLFIKYFPVWAKVVAVFFVTLFLTRIELICSVLHSNLGPLAYERSIFLVHPLWKSLVAFWFLCAGYLFCLVLNKVEHRGLGFILGLVFTISNMLTSQLNPGVDLNMLKMGSNDALFFLNGIMGSIGFLLIFRFLEHYWKFTILDYIGKNSLILMATQRPFYIISMATAGWTIFSGMPGVLGRRYYIDCVGILLIVLIVEYAVITFMNGKGRYLIGKF